ncbi:hypothetical protein BH23PLA1_BH23PLA1_06160 [soil metagenome]
MRPIDRQVVVNNRLGNRWLFLCLCICLPAIILLPDGSKSRSLKADDRPAELVVLRGRETTLKVENRVVARGNVHRVYRVEQSQGDWRWLVAEDVRGWARADQIVPLDRAIVSYTDQIAQGGNVAYAYTMRGLLRADRGESEAALADLSEAIRLRPSLSSAYLNRGIVRRRLGDVDGALVDFNLAIRHHPGDPLAYYNRALAYRDARRLDEAIDDLGRALRFDPAHVSARFNRATLALAVGREGASADAEALLSLAGWDGPNSAYLALIGALSHEHAGRSDKARILLDASKSGLKSSRWPAPLLRFLAGEIELEALLGEAQNETQQAEARAYAGLSLAHKARAQDAVPLLRWVIDHGDPETIPYLLAWVELERLKAAGFPAANASKPQLEADPEGEP